MSEGRGAGIRPFADVRRVVHTIHAVWDYHAARRRYMDVFGALAFAEGYTAGADRDMNLMYVADTMIELMAPRDKPVTFRRFLEKYGEGWHSIEFRVDDPGPMLAKLDLAGVRYVEPVTGSRASWTHPKDSYDMLIEITDSDMPNDPYDYEGWNPRWQAGNPMTLDGLAAVVMAVRDHEGASDFLVSGWRGKLLWSDFVAAPEAPEALHRSMVQVADTRVLLVTPANTTPGPVRQYMSARSPGVYSLAWNVHDIGRARQRLSKLGVRVDEGTAALGAFTLAASDMFGARHELVPVS